jgi:hypothetical protein
LQSVFAENVHKYTLDSAITYVEVFGQLYKSKTIDVL